MGDVSRTNTTTTTLVKSGSNNINDNTRSLITRSSTRCSPTAAARDISEARIISLTRSYGLDVDEVERAHLASLPNDRARKVRCRTLLLGERSDRCGGLARASTFVAPRLAMDEEREDKGKAKANACGGGYVGYGYVGGGSSAAAAAARADAGVMGRNNLVSPDYFEDLDLGDPFGLPKPSTLRRPWTWSGFRSIKRSTTTSSSPSSSTTTLPLYTVRSLPLDPPSPLTTSIPPRSPRHPLPPTSTSTSSPRHVDDSSLAHGLHDPRTPYATTPASGSSSASTLSSYRTAATATTSSTATVVPPPPPSEASASLLSEDLARVLTPASTVRGSDRDGEACERQGREGGEGGEERMRRMRWNRLISLALAALLLVLLVALFVVLIVVLVQEAARVANGGKEGEEA